MQEVKSIALVLENCEVITIAKEHIGLFHCKDKSIEDMVNLNSIVQSI